jgi:hypothetical protein
MNTPVRTALDHDLHLIQDDLLRMSDLTERRPGRAARRRK